MSNSTDAARAQQLQQLTQLANGQHPEGGKVTLQQRMWAGEQLRKIVAEQEAADRAVREADRSHDLTSDQQGHAQELDRAKLQLAAHQEEQQRKLTETLEQRKLDLEADRIEVSKAEVVLRALEIAARNPELSQLTQVVGELSYRLLGGEPLPTMVEDKSHPETD
jgi:hypothetical protein